MYSYIHVFKYSYPYLGPLEFSSGAFILLVGVTRLWVKVTCGKFNWMGMIWKGTHVLIKGPSADNAYESKNQALGSKEQPVELRKQVCIKPHIWGRVQKIFCFFEGSQKHVVSVTLNGRSLKQPGFILSRFFFFSQKILSSVKTKEYTLGIYKKKAPKGPSGSEK